MSKFLESLFKTSRRMVSSPLFIKTARVGVFTTGVVVGINTFQMVKGHLNMKENNIMCAPKLAVKPNNLGTPRFRQNRPAERTNREIGWNRFNYTCLADAMNINMESKDVLNDLKCKTDLQWLKEAGDLFGKEGYGKVMIRHVIVASRQEIENDIYHYREDQKDTSDNSDTEKEGEEKSKAPNYISEDHKNWIWLKKRQTVITFLWDSNVEAYRVTITPSVYVLLEMSQSAVSHEIPWRIKFITSKYPDLAPKAAKDVFVENVVAKFNDDLELFRQNTTFVY